MKVIHAIYENGVFRPRERVDLPDGSEVEFEPRLVAETQSRSHRERIHALLSQSIETGETDMAEHTDQSPEATVIGLLEEATRRLRDGKGQRARVRETLDRIRNHPIIPATGTPDSSELLREDRDR